MKTVLSTKVLTPSQRELFLNSGLGLVEYDAIKIEYLKVAVPLNHGNLIFTSQNAVKAFLKLTKGTDYSKFSGFCVGIKTRALLEENGLKVLETSKNASDLATFIAKFHKNEAFLFFCGNLRRNELPTKLSKNNICYKEVELYKTHLDSKQFRRNFDGILFFSPSGIQSFLQENALGKSRAFCIGDTTAEEAKKHTQNITIANRPTVENVLVQAIKHYTQND
ncbi:uroporphyrinogen-III synthase [Flagellimonas nanhaiensis]|uniref:Uroporphyrinogen-III synthase n=1 Tax=Flagellimonas nanhaiensis TaxID=2292706 RepID=A0A371JR05_9FLAO|nr:uroporphyrinogen-III synthase [Allomuricauda nanhaiensis]RDY59942.1 uroporphyrinogen-III synthase [Allomuricauda nanhaiensis]